MFTCKHRVIMVYMNNIFFRYRTTVHDWRAHGDDKGKRTKEENTRVNDGGFVRETKEEQHTLYREALAKISFDIIRSSGRSTTTTMY